MEAMTDILSYLIQTFLGLYTLAMLSRFLLQLVKADLYNPISQFLIKITNPLVIPLRRVLPGFGGIDLASLVMSVLLQLACIIAMPMQWG